MVCFQLSELYVLTVRDLGTLSLRKWFSSTIFGNRVDLSTKDFMNAFPNVETLKVTISVREFYFNFFLNWKFFMSMENDLGEFNATVLNSNGLWRDNRLVCHSQMPSERQSIALVSDCLACHSFEFLGITVLPLPLFTEASKLHAWFEITCLIRNLPRVLQNLIPWVAIWSKLLRIQISTAIWSGNNDDLPNLLSVQICFLSKLLSMWTMNSE